MYNDSCPCKSIISWCNTVYKSYWKYDWGRNGFSMNTLGFSCLWDVKKPQIYLKQAYCLHSNKKKKKKDNTRHSWKANKALEAAMTQFQLSMQF